MEAEQPQVDSEAAALAAMEEKLFGPAEEEPAEESPEAAPEETEEQPQDDLFEIEADDGERYRVPQKLKDSFLRQSDYTKKTQELAELRRHAIATAEAVQASQQFQQSVAADQAELAKVSADIERYKSIDWTALDTDQYVRLKHQLDGLKERKGEIEQTISGKATQFSQWQQQHKQSLSQQGQQYLRNVIPNWGQQSVQDAAQAALDAGYTNEEVSNVFDPRFVKLAWEAAQFRKLQSGKTAAVQAAQKAPPVVKPGSSDPQMSARMKEVAWAKQMKNAKSPTEKRALAEAKMARFFGA